MAVLPDLLVSAFRKGKRAADLGTSVLSQGALEVYLKSGMLEKHNKKIKGFYHERMSALKKACQANLDSQTVWNIPETGFFVTLALPFPADLLVEHLKAKQVLVTNLAPTYLPEFRPEDRIRLSVCRVDQEQIKTGITILSEAIALLGNEKSARDEHPIDL